MNDKSLLITRPTHDLTTRYISKWSKEIIDVAQVQHYDVVDLEGDKVTRERFLGTLKKKSPKLIVLNGHGNEDVIAGHDDKMILGTSNAEAFGKIIYARACKSAKKLGPALIATGVAAYLGYDEDFIFMIDEDAVYKPTQDKTAALFLEPSNYIPISILKGHTVEDADKRSKAKFAKNIEKLIINGPSSDDYYAVRYLFWNMSHQVCLGDGEAVL